MDRSGPEADWRKADAYAPLLAAERSILAWEWLRRDPGYRGAAIDALAGKADGEGARPQDWGLCAFEHPDLSAPLARPLWTRSAWPDVLEAEAEAEAEEKAPAVDRFDLGRLASLVTAVKEGKAEHLLLSDGLRAIRLDVISGSMPRCGAWLRYRLAGLASAERPLLTLRRLLSLHRAGRFVRSLHPLESKASRWILLLRAHDALAAGAGQREIAALLLNRSANEPRWRSESPSLRSRAQRLVRDARRAAMGGWWKLLA